MCVCVCLEKYNNTRTTVKGLLKYYWRVDEYRIDKTFEKRSVSLYGGFFFLKLLQRYYNVFDPRPFTHKS